MRIPKLKTQSTLSSSTAKFGGYCHRDTCGENLFYDEENMSSSCYPAASPRSPRSPLSGVSAPTGIVRMGDSLCYTEGSCFKIGSYSVNMGLSSGKKTLVTMGAYVIIFPDGKYINTENLSDFGSIDADYASTGQVTVTPCRIDGTALSVITGDTEPTEGSYWLDTSGETAVMKVKSSDVWMNMESSYVKISADGIGSAFEEYDGVTVSGLSSLVDFTTGNAVVAEGELPEGSAVIWARGNNYIVLSGISGTTLSLSNTVRISRKMPLMDYVTEGANRLWGCRYGVDRQGNVVNEIYASALGSFKNWNRFLGISTDSYVLSLGADGAFTGAVTYLGYPTFFKDGSIHKIYGSAPSSFKLSSTACRGIEKGSSLSAAIVGEVLYYKSRYGIMAYDGSLPVCVSEDLGQDCYSAAVGGSFGDRYYISMKDTKNAYHLFVYDTTHGIWHREDSLKAEGFATCGSLYAMTSSGIINMNGSDETVKWHAVTGYIGTGFSERKRLCRLSLRLLTTAASRLTLSVEYDDSGEWEAVASLDGSVKGAVTVPVYPRRCDRFRLRFDGVGDTKILSLTKVITKGSDN